MITVSQHAIDKAVSEFRVDHRVAEDWVRSMFRKSRYISDIISAEGKPCRLYGFQRTAIVVAEDSDHVITVYQRNHAVNEISAKVSAIIERELRKAQRAVKAAERRVSIEKARLKLEIAEAEFKMTITPSKRVIAVNTAKINEIQRKLTELDDELLRAKKEMSAVAKSVVAYV